MITGDNFRSGLSVTVGDNSCAVSQVSSTTITCEIASHTAATVDVVVTNSDGQSETITSAYTFVAAPVITGVYPTTGRSGGNFPITISGNGFQDGATIEVGGNNCSNVVISSLTMATCLVAAHATGTVDVDITNDDLQSDTYESGFEFVSAGDRNPAFGNSGDDGVSTVTPAAGSVIIESSTVQDDQKIVIIGTQTVGSDGNMYLARFNPDGSIDSSFGTNGQLSLNVGLSPTNYNCAGYFVVAHGDYLYAVGMGNYNATPVRDIHVARLNISDGSLAGGWGSLGNGVTRFNTSAGEDWPNAVELIDTNSDGSVDALGIPYTADYQMTYPKSALVDMAVQALSLADGSPVFNTLLDGGETNDNVGPSTDPEWQW